jgi:hypothetical protein
MQGNLASSTSGVIGTLASPAASSGPVAAAGGGGGAMTMPPPPLAPVAAAATPSSAANLAGKNPTEMYLLGVGAMETANWDPAAEAFAATLAALAGEPPGPNTTLRQQFAAQYLAAVLLLKVRLYSAWGS